MKTALKLLLAFLLSTCAAYAQVAVISGQTLNQYGQPIPFASVRVCLVTSTGTPCSTTGVTVYYDYGLTMVAPNPYTSDAYGNYTLFVGNVPSPPNLYEVQLTPAAGITWTYVVNGPFLSTPGNVLTAGIFNATISPYYEINGVQITSAALSDNANIAYLNHSNVFTGAVQTAPTFNATTGFQVGGNPLSCSNGVAGCGSVQINSVLSPIVFSAGVLSCPTCSTSSSSGTVTSVALAVPSWLSVAGSPITSAGTITVSSASGLTANQVLATPNGSAGALGVRSLVSGDLPTVGAGGTFSNPTSITVDVYGRVTAVSGGSVSPTVADYYFSFTGCTITNGSNLNACDGSINFTSGGNTTPSFPAMVDTTYFPTCFVNTGNGYTASINASGPLSTTGFTYAWTEIMSRTFTSSTPTIYCHLHHN